MNPVGVVVCTVAHSDQGFVIRNVSSLARRYVPLTNAGLEDLRPRVGRGLLIDDGEKPELKGVAAASKKAMSWGL